MVKEYSLNDEIKRQLGYIIREERKRRYNQFKAENSGENPYSKENFCDNNSICHYHTLTKLENDLIKDDFVYHQLLAKLGLFFQLEVEDHDNNMKIIAEIRQCLLTAVEYLDYEKVKACQEKLAQFNFTNDCVVQKFIELLNFFTSVHFEKPLTEGDIKNAVIYANFYEGIYKAFSLQAQGLYNLGIHSYKEAEEQLSASESLFKEAGGYEGIKSYPIIDIHIYKNNYYEAVNLSTELEQYYLKTVNYARLIKVYNYLSDFYLLIRSEVNAEKYYHDTLAIVEKHPEFKPLSFMLHFNWGQRKMQEYSFQDAVRYFKDAYQTCFDDRHILQIINRLLLLDTLLKNEENKNELLNRGQAVFNVSSEFEQIIFKYFLYKEHDDNNKYYRRYAQDKVVPMLKEHKNQKILLLLFYEDLYD